MFKVELKADPWWIKLAFTALIYFSENVLKHQSLLNQTKANNNVVSMLYTLIKHATISQSESLLEWFK